MSNKDIALIIKMGKRITDKQGEITLVYKEISSNTGYAVSISSKAVKRAVERNYTKRRVRECLRRFELPKNTGIVFIIRKYPKNISKEVFCDTVCKMVQSV